MLWRGYWLWERMFGGRNEGFVRMMVAVVFAVGSTFSRLQSSPVFVLGFSLRDRELMDGPSHMKKDLRRSTLYFADTLCVLVELQMR